MSLEEYRPALLNFLEALASGYRYFQYGGQPF